MPATSSVVQGDLQLELFALSALRCPVREALAPLRLAGQEALAPIPAQDDRRTGFAPPALPSAGPDAATSPRSSLGDGAGTLPVSPPGGIDARLAAQEKPIVVEPVPADPEPLRNPRNYRITDADRIGIGSLKQKCRQNLVAIALLKQLEAEGRPATEGGKRVLVRYVG